MLSFWALFYLLAVASVMPVQVEMNDTFNKCDSLSSYLEIADQMTEKAKTCSTDKSGSSAVNAECKCAESDLLSIDCSDVLKAGKKKSGLYKVWITTRVLEETELLVYCDMDTDGGGWTVIQRRGPFGKPADYFYNNWASYKKGFGTIKEDFWFGNDAIHALSTQRNTSIRFDLQAVDGTKVYALYDSFWVENEEKKYRLHISGYSGTAGDSMAHHNNRTFSTKDQDNDSSATRDCANEFKGAWWYGNCYMSSLNGLYIPGKYKTTNDDRVVWNGFKGFNESLLYTEMKLRPKDFLRKQ